MNECEMNAMLSAYYDGELPADRHEEVERHLRRCPRCAAELARMKKLTALIHSAAGMEIPPPTLERLHRSVEVFPSLGIRRMAETPAAIAAAILIACLIGVMNQTPSEKKPAAIPVWEAAAVAHRSPEFAYGRSEEILASWIVQDLTWKVEHD